MNRGIFGYSQQGFSEFGQQSLELGRKAIATGQSAIAVGVNCTASNLYSLTLGYGNQDVPFTSPGTTSGYGSPLGSVLLGNFNFGTKSSYASVAVGILNNQTGTTFNATTGAFKGTPIAGTVGKLSTVVGINSKATGLADIAIGYNASANGSTSSFPGHVVIGNSATASSAYANVAIGAGANAGGTGLNVAIGFDALASGSNVVAIGRQCTSSGNGSVAVTNQGTASGNYSSAFGYFTAASGAASLSVGCSTTAAGQNSTTVGLGNVTNSASLNCHLVGGYNFASSTSFASVAFGLLNNQTGGTLNATTGAITGSPAAAATIGRWSVALGITNATSGHFSTAIGNGNTSSGYGSSSCGANNTASSTHAVAFGYQCTASSSNAIAIGNITNVSSGGGLGVGYSHTVSGSYGSALGFSCTASGNYTSAVGFENIAAALNSQCIGRSNFSGTGGLASVAVGILNNQTGGTLNTTTGAITGTPAAATTIGRLSTAIGVGNASSGNFSTAVGYSCTSSGLNSTAVGYGCTASNQDTAAIGRSCSASGYDAVAIGRSCGAGYLGSLAMGSSAVCYSLYATCIGGSVLAGYQSVAIGANCNSSLVTSGIAMGKSCGCNNNYSVAMGLNATTGAVNSMAIGCDQSNTTTTTATNQLVIGTITTAYFGNGVTNASPNNISINATGGSGTNIAGGSLTLAGGISTGTGAGGSVIIKTSPAGTTGSAANALATVATFDSTKLTTLAGRVSHKGEAIPATTLTDAATIATDASTGSNFKVTLGGNRTLGAPTGMIDGQRCSWWIKQDVTGGRTLALNAVFVLVGAVTNPIVSSGPAGGSINKMTAIWDAADSKFYVDGFI